jgi:hypothetical protein
MFDKLETLDDLFGMQFKDLYSAETQLLKILSLTAEKANDSCLRVGFEQHLRETQNQVQRLKQIGQVLDLDLDGHAMAGLVAEGQETTSERTTDEVMDAALIAAAQRSTTKYRAMAPPHTSPSVWATSRPSPYCAKPWKKNSSPTPSSMNWRRATSTKKRNNPLVVVAAA